MMDCIVSQPIDGRTGPRTSRKAFHSGIRRAEKQQSTGDELETGCVVRCRCKVDGSQTSSYRRTDRGRSLCLGYRYARRHSSGCGEAGAFASTAFLRFAHCARSCSECVQVYALLMEDDPVFCTDGQSQSWTSGDGCVRLFSFGQPRRTLAQTTPTLSSTRHSLRRCTSSPKKCVCRPCHQIAAQRTQLLSRIKMLTGIVEVGLFCGMAEVGALTVWASLGRS